MDQTSSRAHNPAADFNRALRAEDTAEAFASLLRAAEAGCLRAQFLTGLAYQTGRGVAVDYERAGGWYRQAACGGDTHAIANLGVMSLLGQGAPADDLDAYAWIQSAVGLGHVSLRPVAEMLERRISGRPDTPACHSMGSTVSPERPAFRACTRAVCDPSRCDLA